MKILIVEDEPSLREIMVQTLRREQYVVEQAADYASALDKIAGYDYDCILLDIMLPDGSGLQLLEELKRQRRQAGIIIISARDSLDDKIEGLELGADDYLPKPFHLAELSARIRSVVRRHQRGGQESLDAGNVRLFPDSRRVEIAGREVELLRKEYDILYYFMSRPNHMIDKTTLAEAVWGDHIDQADNFDFVYAQMKICAAGCTMRRRTSKSVPFTASAINSLRHETRLPHPAPYVLGALAAAGGVGGAFLFHDDRRDQRRSRRFARKLCRGACETQSCGP